MVGHNDVPTCQGAVDRVGDADTPPSSLDANHKIDNAQSLIGTLTDDPAELCWRKSKPKVNGTDDDQLAATNAARKL